MLPYAELQKLARAMQEICAKHNGLGIAAPQVGASARVILIRTPNVIKFIVNPEITPIKERGHKIVQEGCLSYPGEKRRHRRWKRIEIKGTDLQGGPMSEKYSSIAAQVAQHLIDCLNGVVG